MAFDSAVSSAIRLFEIDYESPTAPPVITFSATDTGISLGESTTLLWTVTDALTASIDNGIGSIAFSGSTLVSPTESTKYVLTASNNDGTSTAFVIITIQCDIKRYTTSEGLIGNTVTSIDKDKTSNKIWIATTSGVSLLVNEDFTNFAGLGSASDIIVDNSGRVWLSYSSGGGGVKRIDNNGTVQLSVLSGVTCNSLSVDSSNNIWVSTEVTMYKIPPTATGDGDVVTFKINGF